MKNKKNLKSQFYKARSNYNKWLNKLTSQGFEVPDKYKTLPDIPKNITEASVRRIKSLTEQLKEKSTIEISEYNKLTGQYYDKRINRRQLINKGRAIGRTLRRQEKKKASQAAAKMPKIPKAPEAPFIPPEVSEPVPPPDEFFEEDDTEALEIEFTKFVLEKFKDDVSNIAEALESRGLSKKHLAAVRESTDYLIGAADRYLNSDPDTGYLFAKALEKAKYNGAYIDEKIMYSEAASQEFIMAIESYMDNIDGFDDIRDSFDNISNAQSNSGYSDISDEFDDFMNLNKNDDYDLFDGE